MSVASTMQHCAKCGTACNEALRHCQSCGHDLGAPNVRATKTSEELQALQNRFEQERSNADKSGCLAEFDAFVDIVARQSSVVIAMSAEVALQLVAEEANLYANYEQLVRGEVRTPARF